LDNAHRFSFDPGQFVEVSVFGIGEAPISISSPPRDSSSFELVIRKVGNVTNRLHQMKENDKIGIRGPLGKGFDVHELEGHDLLFVAGGIGMVPMRSLIWYVLDEKHREKYGKVVILYGCRTPQDMLFLDEISEWKRKRDVTVELTVDRCPEGVEWDGCVGVVTTLFDRIKIDNVNKTKAIVIGPPVMYKFVLKCLKDIGIKDENIYVSLERRMKCGVGKCGHCQINGVYVCKEGPVFNYKDIKDLPEAFE
ncbi:MAG TPA: oxidoreductase, partial [Thermoplasmatales archaeon]|nr:oxidoreductase [Thermoplasmatales archaeon]